MSVKRKLLIIAVVLFLIVVVFHNPVTHSIVLFLLPLGGGPDDVIEGLAIVGLFIVLFVRGFTWLGERK